MNHQPLIAGRRIEYINKATGMQSRSGRDHRLVQNSAGRSRDRRLTLPTREGDETVREGQKRCGPLRGRADYTAFVTGAPEKPSIPGVLLSAHLNMNGGECIVIWSIFKPACLPVACFSPAAPLRAPDNGFFGARPNPPPVSALADRRSAPGFGPPASNECYP